MASKNEIKFIASLSFSQEIARLIVLKYQDMPNGNLIQKRAYELYTLADKYMGHFCQKIKAKNKDLIKVAKTVSLMNKKGLDDEKSFQPNLSLLIGLLSERETELIECKAQHKLNCITSLRELSEKCWTYFASRTRKDEFDELGFKLLETFNREFA